MSTAFIAKTISGLCLGQLKIFIGSSWRALAMDKRLKEWHMPWISFDACFLRIPHMQGCFYLKKASLWMFWILVSNFISTSESFFHLSLLYAMDNKRCFLFNVSLSTHFRRQLLQNLGLEVYPMSYSTHFWFALWYFIYYKYYYYDMPIGCLKNQTTVAIGRQFHLVQSE